MPEDQRCELCRDAIAIGAHYVVRIDVFADPATPPLCFDPAEHPVLDDSFDQLMKQLNDLSLDEVQDKVHRRLEYRLCPECHKSYLANPLGRPRGRNGEHGSPGTHSWMRCPPPS